MYLFFVFFTWDFPGGSDDKESSACNAGDPSSIPGSWTRTQGEQGLHLSYSQLYPWHLKQYLANNNKGAITIKS